MTNGMQLSIRHAAVSAGLGEFGYLGIVLTPDFGPRNRFGVILTTLELQPDPLYDGPALCDKCGICARVCPTGAIAEPGTGETSRATVGEKEYEYVALNFPKCTKGILAMNKALGGKEDYLTELEPTYADIAEASKKMPIESNGLSHANSWQCGRCLAYCPAGNWNERFRDTGLTKGAAAAFFADKV
jgi:epoxyqueuosine reductase QueG